MTKQERENPSFLTEYSVKKDTYFIYELYLKQFYKTSVLEYIHLISLLYMSVRS